MGKWKGRDEANTGILGAWLTAHTQGSYMLLLKIEPSPRDGVVSLLIFYACVIIPTAMIVAEKKMQFRSFYYSGEGYARWKCEAALKKFIEMSYFGGIFKSHAQFFS